MSETTFENAKVEEHVGPWACDAPSVSLAGIPAADLEPALHHYLVTVQKLQDLVAWVSKFDSRSFEPVLRTSSEALSELRDRIFQDGEPLHQNLLLRHAETATNALESIASQPKSRITRTYEQLPPAKVRAQDTRCLMKLSRVPGRDAREKIGMARKVPAVVKYRSIDRAENRLAKRVALELRRAVKARLEKEGRPDDRERPELEVLKALGRAASFFDRGAFAELRPSVRPEPNNTLLGHPDYNRVWRLFRVLRKRRETFEQAWKDTILWLPSLTAWSVRSILADSRDVIGTESILRTSLQGKKPICNSVGKSEFILGATGARPRRVSLSADDRRLVIEVGQLDSKARTFEVAGTSQFSFEFAVRRDVPGSWSSSRGMPLTVTGSRSGTDTVYTWEGAADRLGLRELASFILENVDVSLPPREPSEARAPSKYVGIDLLTPNPVLATDTDVEFVKEPAMASSPAVRDSNAFDSTIVGSAAWRCVGEEWEHLGLEQLLWNPQEKADSTTQEAANLVVQHVLSDRVDRGSNLAFAAPDDLDEVGMRQFRSLLPASRRNWLVWRSVAAAMAWRAEGGAPNVAEGDVVLVLDLGAAAATASLLIGRREEGLEESDDWYWERRAVFEATDDGEGSVGVAAFFGEVAEKLGATGAEVTDQAAVRRRLLHEPRLFKAFSHKEPENLRVPCIEQSTTGLSLWTATLSKPLMEEVAQNQLTQFERWLRRLVTTQDAVNKVLEYARDARVHVLLAGMPIELGRSHDFESAVRTHFPMASVHVPGDATTISARGCKEFLKRHAVGLPTWRDIIPDLALEVSTSSGVTRISLLEESQLTYGVRPGQVIQHQAPLAFQIPAGEEDINLPLDSGESEGRKLALHAVVEHESFPLNDPVDVHVHVYYRYAEDAFRLFLRPSGEAPFSEIEVQWARGVASGGGPKVRNLPPAFPDVQDWEGCGLILEDLTTRLSELKTAASAFEKKNKGSMFQRIKNSPSEVVGDVERLAGLTRDISALMIELFPVSRDPNAIPREIQDHLDRVGVQLCKLAGIPPESTKSKKKRKDRSTKPPTKQLWGISKLFSAEESRSRRSIEELESASIRGLSFLRSAAPSIASHYLQALIQCDEASQPQIEALGRMLGTPGGPHRSAWEVVLSRLEELMSQADGSATDLSELRHILWALATAFWTNSLAAPQLSENQEDLLCDVSLRIAERLESDWHKQRVAIELFHEWGLLVLALLRRRRENDTEEHPLHAKAAFCQTLAERVVSIDSALRQRGYEREPRISIDVRDANSDLSPFAGLLRDNLRGHRVALIQLKEN